MGVEDWECYICGGTITHGERCVQLNFGKNVYDEYIDETQVWEVAHQRCLVKLSEKRTEKGGKERMRRCPCCFAKHGKMTNKTAFFYYYQCDVCGNTWRVSRKVKEKSQTHLVSDLCDKCKEPLCVCPHCGRYFCIHCWRKSYAKI